MTDWPGRRVSTGPALAVRAAGDQAASPQPTLRAGDYARSRQGGIDAARHSYLRGRTLPERARGAFDLAADLTGLPALGNSARAFANSDPLSGVTEGVMGLLGLADFGAPVGAIGARAFSRLPTPAPGTLSGGITPGFPRRARGRNVEARDLILARNDGDDATQIAADLDRSGGQSVLSRQSQIRREIRAAQQQGPDAVAALAARHRVTPDELASFAVVQPRGAANVAAAEPRLEAMISMMEGARAQGRPLSQRVIAERLRGAGYANATEDSVKMTLSQIRNGRRQVSPEMLARVRALSAPPPTTPTGTAPFGDPRAYPPQAWEEFGALTQQQNTTGRSNRRPGLFGGR